MENQIQIKLLQQADFRFAVDFGTAAIPVLITDEPAPLGSGQGPNPEQLLGAAVANCLAASLLFAMRKFKNVPSPLRAVATVTPVRNAQNRMRVGSIAVVLILGVAASAVGEERGRRRTALEAPVTGNARRPRARCRRLATRGR